MKAKKYKLENGLKVKEGEYCGRNDLQNMQDVRDTGRYKKKTGQTRIQKR